MRIISGIYKGRKLLPTGLKFTRPTTDFAREGLFNMLNSRVNMEGMDVLDLYTGSGSVVFEFLSRGASSATAVDSSIDSVKFLTEIKKKWLVENLEVIKSDVLRFLEKCHVSFDIIFADPPYDSDDYATIIKLVFEKNMLKPGAYLILEHQKNHSFENEKYFEFHRAFGNVNFSIFSPDKI